MNKRKPILILILIALTAFTLTLAAACNNGNFGGNSGISGASGGSANVSSTSGEAKAVPTGLSVDVLGKATWSRVDGATGYDVDVNGNEYAVKFANFDLLTCDVLPTDGVFNIKVRSANGDAKSDWSEAITHSYSGGKVITPTIVGVDGTTIRWTKPSFNNYNGIDIPKPVLTVGGNAVELADDATAFDLSLASGDAISLYYRADGVYYKDSSKIKLDFDRTKNALSFSKPEKAYMDGNVLRFSEVVGANIYYLEDVYGTKTSISGNDIETLMSDRDRHFLIKAISAGNTDLPIGDSEFTEVTYFTEGEGTEEDPYMLKTPTDLRFIEYYEALNLPKYYKFANDIEFEFYSPADDEDYSNFYNLGSLSGTIDGNGKTLKNIVVYYKDGYSSIFDKITKDGKIFDLNIENTVFRTWTIRTNDGIMHEKGGNAAILANENSGTIDSVTLVSGSVTAVKDGAAGLVSSNRGTIRNCTVEKSFTVYGANEAGAFAAYNSGVIENCINKGSVRGLRSIGGIVGRNAGSVYRCGNEGEISGDKYTGGIVGYNYNVFDGVENQFETTVEQCYNSGKITSMAYAGGVIGKNGSDGVNETGNESYANTKVRACYNVGAVSGITSVGGLIGQNYAYANDEFGVVGCYSTGDVNYNVAGFVENRVYLSAEACNFVKVDDAKVYVYYWKADDTSDIEFPGIEMGETKIGNSTFYYAPMPAYKISGIMFSRVDAFNNKSVYNQTNDLPVAADNTLIYYLDGGFTTATLVQPCAGALVGYNNMINDCYYWLGQKAGGTNEILPITIGGTADTAFGKNKEELRKIADGLNDALGVQDGGEKIFVPVKDGDNYVKFPILAWQTKEAE